MWDVDLAHAFPRPLRGRLRQAEAAHAGEVAQVARQQGRVMQQDDACNQAVRHPDRFALFFQAPPDPGGQIGGLRVQ